MPVNGADVVKAKLFKQGGGYHHAFGMLFDALGQLKQRWSAFKHSLASVLGSGVKTPAHQLRQVAVQRAHGGADAHVVVVQDDQQVGVRNTGVVQRFKRHASGHGAVANDGNYAAVFTLVPGG